MMGGNDVMGHNNDTQMNSLEGLSSASSSIVRNLFGDVPPACSSPLQPSNALCSNEQEFSPIQAIPSMRASEARIDFETKVLGTLSRICIILQELSNQISNLRKERAEDSFKKSFISTNTSTSLVDGGHITPQKAKSELIG